MRRKHKYMAMAAAIFGVIGLLVWYFHYHFVAVLQPRGTISHQERNLIIVGLLLAVLVVVPVYLMTIAIAWKYRAGNTKARYSPDWDGNRAVELTWWAIPGAIILLLSVITWRSSHNLDPFRPLSTTKPPLSIEVVSLDWKWLFIYPSQKIASVNYVQIPVNLPVRFNITSDSVMNSFWVPAWGSQIYSMPGMNTELNLMATEPGSYRGSSANISGQGFAGMSFVAKATNLATFNKWVESSQSSAKWLNLTSYSQLAQPSQNTPVTYYSHADDGLYSYVLSRYMPPSLSAQPDPHLVHQLSGDINQ